MATAKITLATFGTISDGQNFWVVDTKENADKLVLAGGAGVLVSLDGGNLSEWTATKTVGDWTPYQYVIRMGKIQLALNPMTSQSTKTRNFVKELKKVLSGAGAGVTEHTIPAGGTVKSILKDQTVAEFLFNQIEDSRLTGGPDLAFVDNEDATDSDKLLAIARADFNFHWSDEDSGFLTKKSGSQTAYIVAGGTPNLKNYLLSKYLEFYGTVPSRSAVGDTLDALEALCDASNSRVRKLSIRAARSALTDRVWIDLGRRDGGYACINSLGWGMNMSADPDVFFKRTDTVKELPVPLRVPEDKVQEILNTKLRPTFNISDEEWPMVCAWMVTQIVPNYSAPVAMFLGESGSGKTTATSVLSTILENVEDNGALMPDKGDDIAVTISQEKISIWNNVSKISNGTSDDLCQYIDGATYKKRKLRSNNDVIAMTLEPSILLNGISFEDDLRPDLKTRSIVFNMGRMNTPTGSIDDMVNAVKTDHAEILGAIYMLVSQVLREAPNVELPAGGSRMADYLKTILVIDKLWNLNGAAFRRYSQSTSEMSLESTDTAVFKIIHKAVVQGGYLTDAGIYERTFTNDELIAMMRSGDGVGGNAHLELLDLDLKNARRLTSYFNRHITDWKKFGVQLVDHGNNMVDGVRATRKTFTFDPVANGDAWANHVELLALDREADMARGF